MYKCSSCGAEFETPNSVPDFNSEYWGTRVTHYTGVCPSCGSDDYDEMDRCDICRTYIEAGTDLCENCKELVEDLAGSIKDSCRQKSIVHKLNYTEFLTHLIEELDK